MKSLDSLCGKFPIGPTFLIIYLLILGSLDILLRVSIDGIQHFSVPSLFSNTLIYSLYLGMVLLIFKSLFRQEKTMDLIVQICGFFWIISLHPMISYVLDGSIPSGTPFLGLPLIITLFTFSISLILKSISKRKISSSIAAFAATLAASIPIFGLSRVSIDQNSTFVLYEMIHVDPYLQSGWSPGLLTNQSYHLTIIFLLVEIGIVALLFTRIFHPTFLDNVVRSIKPFRTLHFVMMVILGVIFVRSVAPDEALSLTAVNHIPFIVLPALCLALVWQFTTLINDRYDKDIDMRVHPDRPLVSGELDDELHYDILMATALSSSLFSFLIGPHIFLLNLGAIGLAILYSVPPIRLRDRLYGHICVGLGSVIGFLSGVYSPPYWAHGVSIRSSMISRDISFFPELFQVSLLIVVVLSISPLINALADYEGDLNSGVKNVYTVLGLEKGKKLVSVLIIFLFLAPAVLFHTVLDIIFMMVAGIASSMIFYKKEDHRPVFGLYFLVLIYVMIRFLGYL